MNTGTKIKMTKLNRFVHLYLGLILLAIVSCSEQDNENTGEINDEIAGDSISGDRFIIRGTIEASLVNDSLRMVRLSAQSTSPTGQPVFTEIASSEIKKDNSFVLSGQWNGFEACRIEVGGLTEVVILEQTPISINILPKGQDDYEFDISGSVQTTNFNIIRSVAQELFEKDQQLREEITQEGDVTTDQVMQEYQFRRMELYKKYDTELKNKIDSLSPSYAAFIGLSFVNNRTNQDFYFQQADKYAEVIEDHPYAQGLVENVKQAREMMNQLEVGEEAPEIELNTPDGDKMKLSDLRGKTVLLDFWASWCRPCRMESPHLVKVYQKYKSDGFEIFSVSLDQDKESWVRAIEQDNLTWSHVSDLKYWSSEVVPTYKIQGIPQTFLLDEKGVIIASNLRGSELEQKLKEVYGY